MINTQMLQTEAKEERKKKRNKLLRCTTHVSLKEEGNREGGGRGRGREGLFCWLLA